MYQNMVKVIIFTSLIIGFSQKIGDPNATV